jgi:hypothetical protein
VSGSWEFRVKTRDSQIRGIAVPGHYLVPGRRILAALLIKSIFIRVRSQQRGAAMYVFDRIRLKNLSRNAYQLCRRHECLYLRIIDQVHQAEAIVLAGFSFVIVEMGFGVGDRDKQFATSERMCKRTIDVPPW